MRALLTIAALALVALGCKTAPEVVTAELTPPSLPTEDFAITAQTLTQVDVKYTGTIAAGDQAVTVTSASWEFVVDGVVKKSGTSAINQAAGAGEQVAFSLTETLAYVKDEEELKAMDARGGSLLLAMRGTLSVAVTEPARGDQPATTKTLSLPFAKSKEVRTPRLVHLKMIEFEAGRFSEVEVQSTFHLGVVNPNPFSVALSGIEYSLQLSGKTVSKGTLGTGDKVSPASTGVFDVTGTLNEESHGKDAAKIVKGLVVPYVLSAQLTTALSSESLESKGDIKLKATK